MAPIHKDLENVSFLQNEEKGKYDIMVCADSKMRATPACKKVTSKKYKKDNIPTKLCSHHPYEFNENNLNSGEDILEKDEEIEGIVEDVEGENGGTVNPGEPSDNPPDASGNETNPPVTPPSEGGSAGFIDGI